MDFFAGRSCCSQHGTTASRVRASTEGRKAAAIICSGGYGLTGDAEHLTKESHAGVSSLGVGG